MEKCRPESRVFNEETTKSKEIFLANLRGLADICDFGDQIFFIH